MKQKLNLIKSLLKTRKARREEKLFVVEGPHLVEAAIGAIKFVVYAENMPLVDQLKEQGIECLKITRKQFLTLSEVETPQWILAVVRQEHFQLPDLLKINNPLIVFCVGVQDPGNLGTIIRTADAAGVTGIIISKGTVDIYNPKVVRATMGSIFHLPIVQVDSVEETIKQLGLKTVATSLSANKNYYEEDYSKEVVVLVGNEGAGLDEKVVSLCDAKVKIPILGRAESLNVGISTAIILYEAVRQRR